jgi:hypothetical protein
VATHSITDPTAPARHAVGTFGGAPRGLSVALDKDPEPGRGDGDCEERYLDQEKGDGQRVLDCQRVL